MTGSARKAILDRITRNKQRVLDDNPNLKPRQTLDIDDPAARLNHHPRNLVPAVARTEDTAAIRQFVEKSKALETEVIEVPNRAAIPSLVRDWLLRKQLPLLVSLSDDMRDLDWVGADCQEDSGALSPETFTAVTGCIAGMAETGSVVMKSGPGHAAAQNYVPDNHFVVLNKSQLLGGWEDAFDLMRNSDGTTEMPRALSFVSGPSRTADIEFSVELGAHGPRAVVIFLVDA